MVHCGFRINYAATLLIYEHINLQISAAKMLLVYL